jgi:Pentapeptide repeats (8 copies)
MMRTPFRSNGAQWLAGGIAVVVLGLAVTWVLFVPTADWLAHHDVGSATGSLHETAVDNARGRLLTLGAGLFAAGALVFTARNFALSRAGQVTDRYTRAIEQLGSDKLDVRIGSIYALERVAHDSDRDHPTVMEVLTAFIREHSREQWPTPGSDGVEPARSTRPDVQAALTVVGRRVAARDIRPIELRGAVLTAADLTNANLASAVLASAVLTNAYLADVDLTGANLYLADLGGAILTGADFTGALLTGADFGSANLIGARWPWDATVPKGWRQVRGSGRLERAGAGSDSAEAQRPLGNDA